MSKRLIVVLMAVALLATGCKVYGWGPSESGQLGDGTAVLGLPAPVSSGWASVTVDQSHNCGIRVDATMACWGRNYDYDMGLGGRISPELPKPQAGTFTSVAFGWSHTCAVRSDGTLWCAGSNGQGQLGLGYYDSEGEGVELLSQAGTDTDWVAVSAAVYSTCGLKADTSLWCWGGGVVSPAPVDGPGWSHIAGLCGLKADQVWCVSAGGAEQYSTGSGWTAYDAEHGTACAIRVGELWCRGNNDNGQVGDGTTTARPDFVRVGNDTDWTAVGVGRTHACAVKTAGGLWCWGDNEYRQLGAGSGPDVHTPTRLGSDGDWATVSPGSLHTCAVKSNTELWCWGTSGIHGALGLAQGAPIQTLAGTDWTALSAGGSHGCGIKLDSTMWCWGDNEFGQLGVGDLAEHADVIRVGSNADWRAVSAGDIHTCAIKTNGSLYCWGSNIDRQLGVPGLVSHKTAPVRIGSSSWAAVVAEATQSCGVQSSGQLYCWGTSGISGPSSTPLQVGSDSNWARPLDGSCALKADRSLWCWNNVSLAQVQPGIAWRDFARAFAHSCGIRANGTLWCWGWNNYGQLGLGFTSNTNVAPTQVGSANNWRKVAVSGDRTCGLQSSGDLSCWGYNQDGLLGDGTFEDRTTPTPMAPGTHFEGISMNQFVLAWARVP